MTHTKFLLQDIKLAHNIGEINSLPKAKMMINTINAHSYNTAKKDKPFALALSNCDVLIPDGKSIVWACKFLKGTSIPEERIAGWDLFSFEMEQLNRKGGRCMFMGSSENVLEMIRQRAAIDFPNIEVVTYSPPYKKEFSADDNRAIVEAINECNPDLLWIGMTAPKQEKWVYEHWNELNIDCHVGAIGAVFDFYAGTVKRAPLWWQRHGLEWLYRLIREPRRMWRRYLIGNSKFLWYIMKEKFYDA